VGIRAPSRCATLFLLTLLSLAPLRATADPHYISQFATKDPASSRAGDLPRRWKSQLSGNVFEIVLRNRVITVERVASDEEKRTGSELKISVELRESGTSYVGRAVVNTSVVSPEGAIRRCPVENAYTITAITPAQIEGSVVSRALDASCPQVPGDPTIFVWNPTSDSAVSPFAVQQSTLIQLSKEATELLSVFDRAVAEKRYDVAAKTMNEAIAVVRNQLGQNHGIVGRLEGHLGLAYENMGNVNEALSAFQRSAEILAMIPSEEETLWQVRVHLANALFRTGKHHESIALQKLLLKHFEESRGELHIITFTTRNLLALAYMISGQSDEAIAQGTIFVAAARKLYGQDSEQHLDAEELLANTVAQAKKLEQAVDAFNMVYRASERVRGESHAKTLHLGLGYALVLRATGRIKQAAAIAEKVYRGRVAMSLPPKEVLESQKLYGVLLGSIGRYEEGDKLLSDGLRIAKETSPATYETTIEFLEGLCELRTQWGHSADAMMVCGELLDLAESATGRDSLKASVARQLGAEVLYYEGEYDASAALLEKDLQLLVPKFGEKHYNVLITMERLAGVYAQSGRAEEAKPIAEKAYYGLLETLGPNSLHTQGAALGLAIIHVRLGQESQALGLLEQIVHASDRRGDVPNTDAQRELARVYNLMGRKDDAERMILVALKNSVELHGLTPHKDTSRAFQVLASVLQSSGKARETLPVVDGLYKQTLEQLGPYHTETLNMLLGRAYALLAAKEFERGLSALGEGLDAIDAWRRVTSVFDKGRAEHWASFTGHFRLAAYTGALQLSQLSIELSFKLADRAKTGTLYERLSINKVLDTPGAESQEFAKLVEVERNIEQIDSQIAHTEKDIERVGLALERRKLVVAHESLLRTLAKKSPALLQARIGGTVDVVQIAESLSRNAVFVSYLLSPVGGHAYAITKDAGLVVRKIDGVPRLRQTIAAARAFAQVHPSMKGVTFDRLWRLHDGSYQYGRKPSEDGQEVKDDGEISRYLGKLLIDPIADVIKGKQRLIVSPDELIALLPLEMLQFDGRYLIEHFDISYVQSGAMYLLMNQQKRIPEGRANDEHSLLAVGGVDYSSIASGANVKASSESNKTKLRGMRGLGLEWGPLPESRAEVEGVGALFGDKDKLILLGSSASEERLRNLNSTGELKRYRYLLFSTHGYLSDRDPQLSAVVLTPTGTTDDSDGYLTAVELAEYRLNARLLVLSACDTGAGRFVPGEGVQGLPIGAFLAGAENTLMSLWTVVDETTAEFMKSVFKKLLTGKTEVQAVSEAKREFIANKDGLANPLFWAPFVLYGN